MTKKTVKIFGINIFRHDRAEAFRLVSNWKSSDQAGYACFVNVHSLTTSVTQPALQAALNGATFAFPDGMPIVWTSRIYGQAVPERISGPDFMAEFLRIHPGETFGFIGGRAGQAESIGKRFGVRTIAYCPPFRPFSAENAYEDLDLFNKIAGKSGFPPPKYIWVCLGAPKQEKWMQLNQNRAPGCFFFGVGAALDFLSGEKKRSPRWIQYAGFEWLHRLFQEPRRLGTRYLVTNTEFIVRVIREYFKSDRQR